MSRYYRTCPECGANLDPGEICEDCKEKDRPAVPAPDDPHDESEDSIP